MRNFGWLATVLILAACSDSSQPSGDTRIVVINSTGETIFAVYFSECDDLEWNEDQLDADEDILTGAQRGFDVNAGCYDIRADFDEAGVDIVTVRDTTVVDGAFLEWEPQH